MATRGKKYRETKSAVPAGAVELRTAVDFIKAHPGAKFDETVELSVRLGIDPKKTENTVRGSVNLPHGTGKKARILVFAAGTAADTARQAGADYVGMDDMIEKVKSGWTDFDVAIATPDAMKEVRKLGRVLGPRGLMPNPKTGTVTDDIAAAVGQSQAGKVDFRMDKSGNVGMPVGKRSFAAEKLVENAQAAITALRAEKPAGAKGVFFRKCTLSSTMGVGLKLNVTD